MSEIERSVRQWLEQVVIGLNLCPFAGTPYRNGLVRIVVSETATTQGLLVELQSELDLIHAVLPSSLETTLIVLARVLDDFLDFNDFLYDVELLLEREQWTGEFQVASFHPQYRFEGTSQDDIGNWTNRAPWPILHIIREASIDDALESYPQYDAIPDRNVEKMNLLNASQRLELFPWLH